MSRRIGPKTKTDARTKARKSQRRTLRTKASTRTRPRPPGWRCHNSASNPSSPSQWLTFSLWLTRWYNGARTPDAVHECDLERLRPLGGGKAMSDASKSNSETLIGRMTKHL